MPNQEIGVKSIWSNKSFTPALNTYLRSLTNAVTATTNTVASINNLGAVLNTAFNTAHTNGQLLIATLKAIAAQAKRTNTAVASVRQPRAPRAARAVTGGQAANVVGPRTAAQINAATAATQNLGTQAQRTSANMQMLTTRSIAAGVAIGTIAGNALLGLARGFVAFGSQAIEIVTFFERMNLSLNFFAARSIQAEDASISFNDALARGAGEAEGLSIWLQRLAVASPFTTRGVNDIFRTAQAYGLTSEEAQKLTPQLLDLGAAAGLNEDILLRVALALGQIRARGKLTGEEVRQLGNSSIPIRDILVKQLGIANEEFDKLLEQGAFTSDIVIPAITNALKDFEGAGKRVAFETIGGIISAFDDLREIGIAKFFMGLLNPLKSGFQELFKTLNQPEVLAFIQVLGQELGVKLKAAVVGVINTIRGMIAAWLALTPAMQQQIIVFSAATAGVIVLVGAFGLLTIAVGALLSPLSLIAIATGFLVSEWTSGFSVLRGITVRATSGITRALAGVSSSLGNTLSGFLRFLNDANASFVDFVNNFVEYGANIGRSLAQGIASANNAIIASLRGIGSLLSFFLAPGSPPRIAPDINKWGKMTMQEWANSLGDVNVARPIAPVTKRVYDALIDAGPSFREAGGRTMMEYGEGLVAADFIGPLKQHQSRMVSALSSSEVENAAASAGIRVSDEFVNSFLDRIPPMTAKISDELQAVLNKIGGGTQLTRSGALSFSRFIEGFADADFGVLEDTSDVVREFLQSMVDTGEIEEVDLARMLFGAREDLAKGIQDIERVGQVSEDTMSRIRRSAGGASKFVVELLQSYAPLAAATKAAEAAQKVLNDVTEKYKNILAPLRRELEALNEANKQADEQEKILSLRRLIANQGVSDRRRQHAQLQINQIIAERRVRGLEDERDAATETAETELEAREKTRDAMELQFSNLQRNIQAQLAQLGLYGQEASIVRKLREEAEKLREKELTDDQLRMKFLELQGEEMSDLIEAARAKYDLSRADSTELEKQQAQITLATIALRRRNREAEAIKLGIPVEELTKLRDFEVTLDDLGVKTKEAFEFDPSGSMNEGLVNANELTKQWHDTLEKVKKRWDEIKQQITDTATEINNNLPSFLKIFPEHEGGEPPIIGFIKNYGLAVVALAVAINTYKIVSRVASLVIAIRNLMTIGALSTAGGAAAAGGGSAAIAAITTAIVGLGAAALIATGYVLGLKLALSGWIEGETARFKTNTDEIETALGELGPALTEGTSKLIADTDIVNVDAQKALADNITSAATSAILDGFGNEHVVASIGNAINRSIAEGLIADTPENRAAIADFQTNLQTVLASGTTTGEGWKVNLLEGAQISATPSAEQAAEALKGFEGFLTGVEGGETKGAFASAVASLVKDATSLGMTNAQIDSVVFNAFNEGVEAGLVADTQSNRDAVSKYIDDLMTMIKEEGEIKSPSALTEREIGIPLGEGILRGINAAFGEGSTKLVTTTKLMFGDLVSAFTTGKNNIIGIAQDLRDDTVGIFLNLKTTLGTRMGEIITAQKIGWTTIRTDTMRETEALRLDTFTKFEAIRSMLNLKMPEIKNLVVSNFKAMRIASELEIMSMRTAIVNSIAGEEDSLLTDLRETFLGIDSIVPKTIGQLFVEGLADGILENKLKLADAMVEAVQGAFRTVSNLDTTAVNGPMSTRTGTRPGTNSSATATTYSTVNQYNLNVSSNTSSQGIIQDFSIMRTMGPR